MPDEIQAGLTLPIDYGRMRELLEKHLPRIHRAWEQEEVLRERIARGTQLIAEGRLQGLAPAIIEAAERLLVDLERQLREEVWWTTAGLGMALAYGIPEVISQTGTEAGWQPPPGSYIRLVMPGLVNLAVTLKEKP